MIPFLGKLFGNEEMYGIDGGKIWSLIHIDHTERTEEEVEGLLYRSYTVEGWKPWGG